jgi:hypothetical protein
MSIKAHLKSLEGAGKITRFAAPVPFSSRRALYLAPELMKELTNPSSHVNFHKAAADCERMMERWVKGDPMNISLGGPGRGSMLARLDPPPSDVWELRVTDPRPQFRIFCQFAGPDILIATSVENRNLLGEKARGRKRSDAWSKAMYGCTEKCGELLAPFKPFSSDNAADYVTEKCNVI